MTRSFDRYKHKDISQSSRTGMTVPTHRDPTHHATVGESHHGKPTVEVGSTHYPARNLIKQFTNYSDSTIQVDTPSFQTALVQRTYVDFELRTAKFHSVSRCYLAIVLRNLSTDIGWTLPNIWNLINTIQILWNGNDQEESYDKSHIREALLLYNRNIESSSRVMHFNPPSRETGSVYLPRNQASRCAIYDATDDVAGIDFATPADCPSSIPSNDPLFIPANSSRVFRIDLSWLPLFSGHLHFPNIIDKGVRLRIYFETSGTIIGDSTYSNTASTIGALNQMNYLHMADAQAANKFIIQNLELQIRGTYYTDPLLVTEMTRRHESFAFKCLMPRRMYISVSCTTGVNNQENKPLTSMVGTFAMWTLYLRDPDAETAPRKSEWYNAIQDITEIDGNGTTRDYDRKPAYLFSNLVDEVNFAMGTDYFTHMSDYGQSMYADPRHRGTTKANGTLTAIGPSITNDTPYRHTDGLSKRALGLPYSAQPMKDFWWGTQYGGQYFNGGDTFRFTPGVRFGGAALNGTIQNLWIVGWQYASVHWNGKEFNTIKQ